MTTGVAGPGSGASASKTFRQLQYERPPGSTEMVLVRHGETVPAVTGESFDLVDGQGDPPLSPQGHDQADRLARRLARYGIQAVYATVMKRTVQTAEPLVRDMGLSLRIERDLREVHLGEWEGGKFRRKVLAQHPVAVLLFQEQRWDVIPGAEDTEAFSARVRSAVVRIAAAHPDQRVAIFTHAGVIGRILSEATGSQPFAFNADNASISHMVVAGDKWTLRRFNDTAHLDEGLTVRSQPLT
ncbi:MAG: histidine phosphatase family protein [Actinobacteria bacterium]|nr:histidine phosphatase family protein [Actinomycetota bacterium]MBW3651592.1 histidine phosphatase family protein [Actinomycetota bacterium]